MLTFRAGSAGSPSAAGAMADHLREQTLPADKAELARYYQAGMVADFAGDMAGDGFAVEAQALLNRGLPLSALPEALGEAIAVKHGGGVDDWLDGQTGLPPTLDRLTTLAEWTVVQDTPGDEAAFIDHRLEPFGSEVQTAYARAVGEASYRYDKVLELAADNALGHTAAVPRQDINPALADRLKLDPTRSPTRDEIAHLLNGRRADGAEIEGRQRQRATADKARIGYYDLTFSADKSLSVAWAFAPTEAERNILMQAHRDAVGSAMAYVAAEVGRARVGKAGAGGSEVGHIGWIAFDHYTARPTVEIARTGPKGEAYTELVTMKAAGDPQLHTHVAVPNVVLTDAGRLGGLDTNNLADRVHEFGAYYQAHVAANLRRSGVDVVLDDATGSARLAAVPNHVREAFSKRTRNGTEAAREFARDQGLDWDTLSAARKVGLLKGGTQTHTQGKTARKDDIGDTAAWERQAATLNYGHRSVLRPDRAPAVLSRDKRLEGSLASALPLLDRRLGQRAKLDGQELRTIAARGLIAGGIESPADIDALTRAFRERGVQQDGRQTALVWGDDAPVRGRARIGVTTALHAEQESALIGMVRAAAADRSADLAPVDMARAMARAEIKPTPEQRRVIEQLGTGGRFAVAIGVAGSGKTTLLAPLVDAWQREGRDVHGVALAWRQATALGEAGIPTNRLAALTPFLIRAEGENHGLTRRSIVVIDEVSLIGTGQMLALARAQAAHGFKVVAIGDPKQGQAIAAGSAMNLLGRALGTAAIPELLEVHRQKTEAERTTALMFREGRADEAIERKRANGTSILVPGDHAAAITTIAALWQARIDTGASVTVSAPTNSDARAISEAIRVLRRERGAVGPDLRTIAAQDQSGASYGLALALGDRVRLYDRTNASFGGSSGNIGNNGSVLTVAAISDEAITLRTGGGRVGVVKWTTLADKVSGRTRLAYGDVMTIDAIQGLTSGEHIHAMPSGSKEVDGYRAYVAESRHRTTTWMVVSDGAERREISGRRPLGDGRSLSEADVWANVGRNLSRQPDAPGALNFLEQAANVRSSAIGRRLAVLEPFERAAAAGQPARFRVKNGGNTGNTLSPRLDASRQFSFSSIPATVREAFSERWERLRPMLEQAIAPVSTTRQRRGLKL